MSDKELLPDNWGRWGDNDDRGALNLITDEVRARAAAEVRTGRWASLALPITPTPLLSGPFVPSSTAESPVQQVMAHSLNLKDSTTAVVDVLVVTNHHPRSTHIDSLGHIVTDDHVYPGLPAAEGASPAGLSRGSSSAYSEGIVTRGVLLDLAVDGPLPQHYGVTADDLEAAERRQGVRVESGDALIIRGGWEFAPNPERPAPGMSVDAVRWMHRRGVSLYAGDIGDTFPPIDADTPSPMHSVALVRMGVPLIDAPNVDDVAALCGELRRYSFLLTVAPPRIGGTTGLPVNPIALF